MANTIQIKRSAWNGTDAPSSLLAGEPALLQGSSPKKLYIGRENDSGGTVEVWHVTTLEDLTAGDGLAMSAAASASVRGRTLSINVDDSSIETNSDTIRVKASGVTNAMLGGSITNAKLSNSSLTVTAGDGLSGGGSIALGATGSLAVDLNELTAAAVDVAADSIALIDATDNGSKKEAIADIVTAIAGSGLTAASGVLSASSGELTDTAVDIATDSITFIDSSDSDADKKDTAADFISAMAGDGLGQNGTSKALEVKVDDSSIETNSDALRVKASGITNAMLGGSIANSKLSNSAVTVTAGDGLSGGGSVALGASVSLAVGVDDSSIETDSDQLRVKASGITNAMLAGSIANGKLSNSAITIGGTSTSLGGTITALTALTDLDMTASNHTIFDTVGANTLTIGAGGTTVNIAGSLTVSGTSTTVESTTVVVEDPLMKLSKDSNSDTADIGFYGRYSDDSGSTIKYKGIFADVDNSDTFTFFKGLQAEPTTTVNVSGTGYALADIKCGTIDGASISGGSF